MYVCCRFFVVCIIEKDTYVYIKYNISGYIIYTCVLRHIIYDDPEVSIIIIIIYK